MERPLTPEAFKEALPYAGIAVEAVLVALLVHGRVYRRLPVFFWFMTWNLCCDATMLFAFCRVSVDAYLRFYLVSLTLETLLEFAVLAELGLVVLRYNRARAPRRSMLLLLLMVATLLVWSLARWSAPQNLPQLSQLYIHMRQAFAILRVAFLLAIAWWNSLQDLRWPDEALRVATGIGFYSIVELAVNIAHTRQSYGPAYQYLDEAMVLSYLGTVFYWVLSFGQKEEKRQKIAAQT
jgi:hypothetical protein